MNDTVKQISRVLILPVIIVAVALLYVYSVSPGNELSGVDDLGAVGIFNAYPIEGWGSAWLTTPEYDGVDMPDNALVVADNIDFGVKTSIAPRQGTTILGTEVATTNAVNTLHTIKSLDGRELLLKTVSGTLNWWNSIDSDWDELDTGYTVEQDFDFAVGNISTETANYAYFVNNVEAIRRFRVGFGTVSSNATNTLTLNSVTGFDSADDVGFLASTSTVTVNGADYAYTGITGWQLTGLSGLPTFDLNEGVIATVETTGFTDPPSSAIALVIKDQRMYAAYQNSVYASNIDDFRDFSYSATRVASEGEIIIFPDGGDKITSLAVRPEYVAVFKEDYIGSLAFKDFGANLSDIPVVQTVAMGENIGSTNQKTIAHNNFSVLFANDDLGLSELSRYEGKDFDERRNLLDRVRPSIEDFNFSNAASIVFKDYILLSARDDSDYNNTILVLDFVHNRLTEFANLNANDFAVYDDELYYAEALTDNVYKLFTGNYDDNNNPYTTEWKTKWFNFNAPAQWKELGWVFVEGFITSGTNIAFTIYLDEGGSYTSKEVTISGDGDYVSSSSSLEQFGLNPFGLKPFSSESDSSSNLRHFVGFINTSDLFDKKFRNIQFGGKTSKIDSNYRITRIIPYVNVLNESYGIGDTELILND